MSRRGIKLAVATISLLMGTSCALAGRGLDEQTSSSSSPLALSTARVQAGLPDCPVTDLSAEAIPDGLPATDLACIGAGRRVNLAGLPREPMIINIWAQWCGPCREESAYLSEAATKLKGKVGFLGINYLDPREDLAIEFAGLVGWRYPHITDPERTLRGPLRVSGLPTTLFVSADGRVVGRRTGIINSTEELLDLVAQHLGTR